MATEDKPKTLPSIAGDMDMAPHSDHYKSRAEHVQAEMIDPKVVEPIHLIESLNLDFRLGNAVKYIARAEVKGTPKEDLQKAIWYIERWLKIHDLTD